MTPQAPEVDLVEEMPMTYSLEKSSFGLLLDREGSSSTLFTSIALVAVILAGTFLIVMETGRSAKASQPRQTNAAPVATSAAPAVKQIAELKTVDLEAKPAETPTVTASTTPAPAVTTPLPAVTTPAKAAVTTAPVKTQAATPGKTPPIKNAVVAKTVAPAAAARPGPQVLMAQVTKPANPTIAKAPARAAKQTDVVKHVAKTSKGAVDAKTQPSGDPGLMTIMPDPPSQVEHHASVSAPVSAPPATIAVVKSVQLPARKAKRQVADTGIGDRVKAVSGAAKTKGSIETVDIPTTAGTGLVGARGAVGTTGIKTATVVVPQAEAAKKVGSAGIPGQTRLTIATKRPVAPAPANLDLLSRRSTATNRQVN